MNIFDIVLLVFILIGSLRGLWNGFFVTLASFISVLVGIYIAIKFSSFTADVLRSNIAKNWEHLEIIAFAITFIVIVVSITLLAKIFSKIADFSGLGIFNKLLGGLLGLLKTILILSVMLHFFQKVNQNYSLVAKETLDTSLLYQPISEISDVIFPTLSEWFDTLKNETFSNSET